PRNPSSVVESIVAVAARSLFWMVRVDMVRFSCGAGASACGSRNVSPSGHGWIRRPDAGRDVEIRSAIEGSKRWEIDPEAADPDRRRRIAARRATARQFLENAHDSRPWRV